MTIKKQHVIGIFDGVVGAAVNALVSINEALRRARLYLDG